MSATAMRFLATRRFAGEEVLPIINDHRGATVTEPTR
jgi:hypothetical protein